MAAARKPKKTEPKDVASTAHDDTRLNIPTADLADFVGEEHRLNPPGRYERDRTLDPQLVWAGKDAQDLAEYLSVTTVPIYIQEKIQPQALIENLRVATDVNEEDRELRLFEDFNGLAPDQTVEFYEHDVNWSNRMILGDALLVMNSLAEKENLRGKVQMIYIDPPYGIKFGSNWQVSTRKRDVADGKASDVTRQPEQVKAFRDTWALGIHSYLSYLRDRLTVSRELLSDSGSCFVQIGDENVHLVRSVLDEVFGAENSVSLITFVKTAGGAAAGLPGVFDLILWYAKDRTCMKSRPVFRSKEYGEPGAGQYNWVEEADGSRRALRSEELPPAGSRVFAHNPLVSPRPAQGADVRSFEFEGQQFTPGSGTFKSDLSGLNRLAAANRLIALGKSLRYVRFIDDFPASPITNLWTDTLISGFGDPKVYAVQTNTKVVQRCMLMTTDPGDLVLDPTCGSGTTAYVAEQWARRWITIDTSRVALALARTRLMCGRYPYYLLSDSEEGARKEAELSGRLDTPSDFGRDVKKGFVYKRVKHVTLKSITQNLDITAGMSREQVDAAIARHADTEPLVDQPYEDRGRVRVTGRFTVESLSPHRNLPGENAEPTASEEVAGVDGAAPGYEQTILANLRRSGVHNTFRGEHIKFERLDVLSGEWLQGEGEFTDAKGESRTAAVSLGPEHGTVSGDHIKEAAREALRGRGYDLLLVCGFAFEARSAEVAKEFQPSNEGFATAIDARQHGKLPVLRVNMNPDLAMGGELLKKTGAGNLFMVFGEPDIEIRKGDATVVVQLHGLDVYDPTTGAVRSASTDDVMAWFVDTNYSGDAFYVRHAYFTGADDPYQKLRRDLKAEISEEAWASLYSTTSRPFPAPETGRIAIKVINHFGDEVLQVYEV